MLTKLLEEFINCFMVTFVYFAKYLYEKSLIKINLNIFIGTKIVCQWWGKWS